MTRPIFLYLSIFILSSCTSIDSCKIRIIQYKINTDNILNEDITIKNYSIELIDTIVPGIKCKFY